MNIKKLGKELLIESLKQGLLCAGILLFFTFYFGITLTNLAPAFTFGLFLLPVTFITANVFSKRLIPNYLITEKYFQFGLYSVYTIIISVFFIVISCFYGLIITDSLVNLEREFLATKNLYLIIIGVYMVVLVVSLFAVYRESFKINLKNQELQYALLDGQLQLKKEELSYLKMQIHPHFLFNTLNTIYGSAISQRKSTPDLILKLSNLLDYILYQTKKSLVPLNQEIDHLKDYIALEELRHGKNLEVKTSFPKRSDDILIPPMLLLPFLENSFKHGKGYDKAAFIDLAIETENDTISFSLKNSFEKAVEPKSEDSSGIGLANIKKRLNLIYPDAHELRIEPGKGIYEVKLKLETDKVNTNELPDY